MSITSFIRSKVTQVVPFALLGVIALGSATPAHAAINLVELANIQSQLQFISTQIQLLSGSPAGEVLGASTTVAVRPACSLTLDRKTYVIGNPIVASWSTSGGATVEFIPTPGQEGKDNQTFPTDKLPASGSRSINANVLGLPSLTLRVTSPTGNTAVCTRFFSAVKLGTSEKDVVLNQLYATLLQLQTRVESLQTQYQTIGQQIDNVTKQINDTNVKIATIQNASTTQGTTSAIYLTAGAKTATLVNASSSQPYGNFTQKIQLQARGETFYVPLTTVRFPSTTKSGVYYQIEDVNGMAVTSGLSNGASVQSVSGGTVSNGYLKIQDGSTATIQINVPYSPAVTGYYRLQVAGIAYATTPVLPNTSVGALPPQDFETSIISIPSTVTSSTYSNIPVVLHAALESPSAQTIVLSDKVTSDWSTIFNFDLTNDTLQKAAISQVGLTVQTNLGSYSDLVADAKLVVDNMTYTGAVVTAGTSTSAIRFNTTDGLTIDSKQIRHAALSLRFKPLRASNEGASVKVSIYGTQLTGVNGFGLVTGNSMTLRTVGIVAQQTNQSISSHVDPYDTSKNTATFTSTLELTAIGASDQYIGTQVGRGDSFALQPLTYVVENSNGAVVSTGTTTATFVRVSGGTSSGNYTKIAAGSTATFKLTVTFDPTATGSYRVQAGSIGYAATPTAPTKSMVLSPASDFETATVYILN